MNYKSFFKKELDRFKDQGLYRNFREIDRPINKFPKADETNGKKIRDVEVWCTNDYLNMSQHPEVVNETVKTLLEIGSGSGGTRNISGTTSYHTALESCLADLHNKSSALVFSSAYTANQSTLWTLGKKIKNMEIFSDELNHASLIQGIKNSGSHCTIFKHNDLEDLEEKLKSIEFKTPKLIVFESLYSMDGTITNVAEYVRLAKKYNALTYLDEVHAVGLYGERGSGIANKYGVSKEIDIINGTLAKAFGQIGGYVAGDKYIIEFIRSFTPGFIFTTSLMPSVVAACKKSIEIVEQSNHLRSEVLEKAAYLKKNLDNLGINYIKGDSHIIPIIVNTAEKAQLFSQKLLDIHNIYTQPIFYPTVPKGSARLRITITPKHSLLDIDNLVGSLSKVLGNKKAVHRKDKKSSNSPLSRLNTFKTAS